MNYELLDKYIVHYVSDKSYGDYVDMHTHGLVENFNHKDIQVVRLYRPQEASVLFNMLVESISKGTRYEPGVKYSDLHPAGDIIFIPCKEGNRVVLRMLIPDLPLGDISEGQTSFDPEVAHDSII